jgi:hypothetical protein
MLLIAYSLVMPRGLHRYYGANELHFVTCSCYHRMPNLRSIRSRDCFLSILEQTRKRYRFVVVGYVVMPERHPPCGSIRPQARTSGAWTGHPPEIK